MLIGEDDEREAEVSQLLASSGCLVHRARLSGKTARDGSTKAAYDALVMIGEPSRPVFETDQWPSGTRILLTPESNFQTKQRAFQAGFRYVLPRDRWATSLIHHISEARRPLRESMETQPALGALISIKDKLNPLLADLPILVIDDIEMNRDIAGRQLRKLGLNYETANDGKDGLHVATSRPFSAVIVDCSMPVMDGYEFTKRFRDWEYRQGAALPRRLPVIALTANVTIDDAARCIAAGMDDYMAKPLTIGGLSVMLKKWLGGDTHRDRGLGAETDSSDSDTRTEHTAPTVLGAPIDIEKLHEIYGVVENDELREIIEDFLTIYADLHLRIERAIESRDRVGLREAVHAAKGASSYVGATALFEILAAMEKFAPNADWSQVEESLKFASDEIGIIQLFAKTQEEGS